MGLLVTLCTWVTVGGFLEGWLFGVLMLGICRVCEGERAAGIGFGVQKRNAEWELWLEFLGVESEVCVLLFSCWVVGLGISVNGIGLMRNQRLVFLLVCWFEDF